MGMIVVDYENGEAIGTIYKDQHGYYVIQLISNLYTLSEWVLRALADKLKDLNAAHDLQVQTYMATEKNSDHHN
jgi:hypothetical protein